MDEKTRQNIKELEKFDYIFMVCLTDDDTENEKFPSNQWINNNLRLLLCGSHYDKNQNEALSELMKPLELENLNSVVPNSDMYYEIIFNSYITYSVTYESCIGIDKTEIAEGKNFCEIQESEFKSFSSERYGFSNDSTIKCYKIYCANQIIEILCLDEPVVVKYIKNFKWLPYPHFVYN